MAYHKPNYTQTPNELFDTHMPLMKLAELKVTLALVRRTIGWHKEGPIPMSVADFMAATGLTSENSVRTGIKNGIARGTIIEHPDRGPRGIKLYDLAYFRDDLPMPTPDPDPIDEPDSPADSPPQNLRGSENAGDQFVTGSDTSTPANNEGVQGESLKKDSKEKDLGPDGADEPPAPITQSPRPRDLIFELVVTDGFAVSLDDKAAVEAIRSNANWISSWAKGNAVKMNSRDRNKSLPGCDPPLTPEELKRFYAWMQVHHAGIEITTAPVYAKYVGKARKRWGRADPKPKQHFPAPGRNCDTCHGAGMLRGANDISVPCPDCLNAERETQDDAA